MALIAKCPNLNTQNTKKGGLDQYGTKHFEV